MINGRMIALLTCFAVACYGSWPTYHGDSSLNGVGEAKLSGKLEMAWRYNAGGEVYGTPVSDGTHIFFTAKKGRVVVLDLNGSEVWTKLFTRTNDAGQEMPVRFEAPVVCTAGLVFAGTTKGTLIALDAKTGDEKWRYETGGVITASPNIIEPRNTQKTRKIVVLDQSEGALHCIDTKTGKLLWKTKAVERCDGAPGIGGEHIVFGSCLAALHVFSIDGKHLKDIEVGGDGQIAGGVAVEIEQAFAGTRDGSLLCVDLEKGDIVWESAESEDQTFSTPAVADKLVVYASDDGFVYAVEKEDGKLAWKFDTGGMPYSPVVTEDCVVVAADGILYLLKLDDGTKLWSKEVSDDITSPAILAGMIVVGADDGTVSCWRATTL